MQNRRWGSYTKKFFTRRPACPDGLQLGRTESQNIDLHLPRGKVFSHLFTKLVLNRKAEMFIDDTRSLLDWDISSCNCSHYISYSIPERCVIIIVPFVRSLHISKSPAVCLRCWQRLGEWVLLNGSLWSECKFPQLVRQTRIRSKGVSKWQRPSAWAWERILLVSNVC